VTQVTPPAVPIRLFFFPAERTHFSAFAGRTVANAKRHYGATSTEQNAVADAWNKVGVKPA
jgi:Zn-dependent metalloprotease